jgi:hypothetical protein
MAGDAAQVVELLPTKHKALSSNPNTAKQHNNKNHSKQHTHTHKR